MAKPTVIDALNDALGLADTSGEDSNAAEGGEEGDDEGGDADGDPDLGEGDEEGDGGEGDADGDEADADEEGEEGEEGAEVEGGEGVDEGLGRNPDGTFKKKADEKPGEKPGEKTGDKRQPDALNDPIPKNLNQETRDRMVSLIKTTKEVTAERDEVRQQFGTFVGGLQAANVTPEQYGETLSWLSLFNSGDPAQQEKALELVDGIADRLATLLGKERSGSDPLKGHADLITLVQQGKVTKEVASELARTRNQGAFQKQLNTNATQQQQQQNQQQQALQTARSELHTLEETLRQTDRNYERKKAMIVPILKPIMKSLPPSQWKSKFVEAYNAVQLPNDRRAAGAGGKKPGNRQGMPKSQPMRAGKQPAGGQARQATSPLDAMNGALSNMGK